MKLLLTPALLGTLYCLRWSGDGSKSKNKERVRLTQTELLALSSFWYFDLLVSIFSVF